VNLRTFAASALVALFVTGLAGAQSQDKHPSAPAARLAQQPGVAPAPAATAHVEVLVLEGSAGDAGVASSLSNLRQLRQPPFNTYPQISVLSRTTLSLSAAPATAALPNGGSARVTLAGRSPEGRYTVDVALVQGGQTSNIQFVVGSGEPFFTVRARRPDQALIFGFIVRP
jgi:hypothetical protein